MLSHWVIRASQGHSLAACCLCFVSLIFGTLCNSHLLVILPPNSLKLYEILAFFG